MSLTRANAEFIVHARVGPLMTSAGMDGTTVDGSNLDLNDPCGRAVRALGYVVTSAILVTDADVAQVTVAQEDEFFDYVTLFTLRTILTNLDDVEIRVGPRTEKLNQLAEQVERAIKLLQETMTEDYSYGYATPVARVITRDIAEHDQGLEKLLEKTSADFMASFDQLASVTASTKRGGGYDANGLEIAYKENIASLKCLPLDPIDPQVTLGIEGRGWSEASQTAVQGGLDIVEGDLLVVAGIEYPIRAVADWTWPPSAKAYQILFLEDKK